MEYKKNKKKFSLSFKKLVAEKAVSNKRKLEQDKPKSVWNEKKRRWTQPNTQVGYKARTVREVFTDMTNEKNDTEDFKSCLKFVGRCEELLKNGKFDIEGNSSQSKFRVLGAGAPKRCLGVRRELFEFFIDIRSCLKARLPKKIFLAKAKSLYDEYCEWKRQEGLEPKKLTFSNRWLKDWCREYQISMKRPNKRFSISADARKKRITDFLKNIWTVRHTFIQLYGIDPEIIMSDQMPLHRNESSSEKTLNYKGAAQTTFVKENHSLSRERITAMTSVTSEKQSSAPKLEFVFKGAGKRVKLNPSKGVTTQWAPKGSYRLEHDVNFCKQVPHQPTALFPKTRKIFTLDDYSAHLDKEVKDTLYDQGYFLVILPGGITGDLQVNDTDLHHPLKSAYRERESELMIKKLRDDPSKIPSPSRDEIMKMCKEAYSHVLSTVDVVDAFKRNGITISLDGSEDHLVSNRLKTLVWDELTLFRTQLLSQPHPTNLKQLEDKMIPPDGVKRKLDAVVDSIPPDEGEEIDDGELTDHEWNDRELLNMASSDEEEEENESIPLPPPSEESQTLNSELKENLNSLERINELIKSERKRHVETSSLQPFLVKMENMVASERNRQRTLDCKRRKENLLVENALAEVQDDNNAFDLFHL